MENNTASRVECSAAKDPLIRSFAMAAILIGTGIWCWLDSAKYPAPQAWDFKHINETSSYLFNHYLPYVVWPIGAIIAVMGLISSKLKLIADEDGIGYRGKTRCRWENIDALDATELKSKGWIYLETGGKKIKLDSWKLTNFKALIEIIEKNLPAEKQKF
ncbi:MAG TPA: hypothetical protein PKK48_05435 [Phycisphaerae bacterium]|nr:hypothetical protein [Phycisphaerae bacterium]